VLSRCKVRKIPAFQDAVTFAELDGCDVHGSMFCWQVKSDDPEGSFEVDVHGNLFPVLTCGKFNVRGLAGDWEIGLVCGCPLNLAWPANGATCAQFERQVP